MPISDWPKVHLLRRAGFGLAPDDWEDLRLLPFSQVVDWLVDYESEPDDVDSWRGNPEYAAVAPPRGAVFSPNTVITDARQR
jgi:hypothetical protein